MNNILRHSALLSNYTREIDFFRHIYQTRPHVSEVSNEPIRFAPHCFAHVIPKGKYRHFKFYDLNIVLMTPDEHHLYDHAIHKARLDPRFDWVFLLGDLLRKKYDLILNSWNIY